MVIRSGIRPQSFFLSSHSIDCSWKEVCNLCIKLGLETRIQHLFGDICSHYVSDVCFPKCLKKGLHAIAAEPLNKLFLEGRLQFVYHAWIRNPYSTFARRYLFWFALTRLPRGVATRHANMAVFSRHMVSAMCAFRNAWWKDYMQLPPSR